MSLVEIIPQSVRFWLASNSNWVEPLGAVLAILGGVAVFLRKQVTFLFKKIRNGIKKDTSLPSTRITFVLKGDQTLWTMGSRGNIPVMHIVTSWYVTNASSVPISILSAGLLKPNVRDRICRPMLMMVGRNNVGYQSLDIPIALGQTQELSLSFMVEPPTQSETKDLKLRLFVVDQYGKKHKAPKVKMKYKFPSAETY